MATSILRSLQRTGSNLLTKNNRWGSRLAASKKSKNCSSLFNNNIKGIISARQYSKDVKKEDSVDITNNKFLQGDMRSKLHQILPDDPQGRYLILYTPTHYFRIFGTIILDAPIRVKYGPLIASILRSMNQFTKYNNF